MASPAFDDVLFPLAHCGVCDRDVLGYLDADEVGEVRRCLECDGLLPEWREASAEELEAAGYALLEARGCGNGGGCGAGGCGRS